MDTHKPMEFMTPEQAAKYLQLHKMTVYRLVKKRHHSALQDRRPDKVQQKQTYSMGGKQPCQRLKN